MEWTQRDRGNVHLLVMLGKYLLATQHLPWGENRPYNDGDLYNCLVIKSTMSDIEQPHFQKNNLNVVDEVSQIETIHLFNSCISLELHLSILSYL